ncbi:MAG: PDZ domain-containing protein, partial [Bradymonadaceae bacterium]
QPLTEKLAETFGVSPDAGVLIGSVQEGLPAAKAGLKRGDVITHFDGERIKSIQDLMFAVAETDPGTTVTVEVLRDGEKKTFELTVDSRPDARHAGRGRGGSSDGKADGTDRLGVEVAPVEGRLARRLGVEPGRGVVVRKVERGSPAGRALKRGDVILRVGSKTIGSPSELDEALSNYESGEVVRMRVMRRGTAIFVAVRLGNRE